MNTVVDASSWIVGHDCPHLLINTERVGSAWWHIAVSSASCIVSSYNLPILSMFKVSKGDALQGFGLGQLQNAGPQWSPDHLDTGQPMKADHGNDSPCRPHQWEIQLLIHWCLASPPKLRLLRRSTTTAAWLVAASTATLKELHTTVKTEHVWYHMTYLYALFKNHPVYLHDWILFTTMMVHAEIEHAFCDTVHPRVYYQIGKSQNYDIRCIPPRPNWGIVDSTVVYCNGTSLSCMGIDAPLARELQTNRVSMDFQSGPIAA